MTEQNRFNLHLGDQGSLSSGLFDEITKVLSQYEDTMTAAGVIGVLEAVKFDVMASLFFEQAEVDDDDEADED